MNLSTQTPSIRYVKGIGPEREKLFNKLNIRNIGELARHYPRRYEDRRLNPDVQLSNSSSRLFEGTVSKVSLFSARNSRRIFQIDVEIPGQKKPLRAMWFNCAYLKSVFVRGQAVALYGQLQPRPGAMTLIHPDYEILSSKASYRVHTNRIVPVYGLTQDLSQRTVRSCMYHVLLDLLPRVRDPIPKQILKDSNLETLRFALKAIHFPKNFDEIKIAYKRLVFDEFFIIQLMMMKIKKRPSLSKRLVKGSLSDIQEFERLLPFDLTEHQKKCCEAVLKDMKSTNSMSRLIQGDVGSGKTVIAVFASWLAAKSGMQSAVVVPTAVLAQQHLITFTQILVRCGMKVALYVGDLPSELRLKTQMQIKSGEADIVIGTHALFANEMIFKKKGLVIIDEQHKFGVMQRESLLGKSSNSHVLTMSATPIPRSIAMTLYGNLDISTIEDERHKKKMIRTLWMKNDAYLKMDEIIMQELERGFQAYWVMPSIKANRKKQVGIEGRKNSLLKRFPGKKIGVLHGKLTIDQKNTIMKNFKQKQLDILLSTTVVEVGVDVANATVMVIEEAENFGISQLHQLRGRVGRGKNQGVCFVLTPSEVSEVSERRLQSFVASQSGFDLAEEDLRIRGPGDAIGVRQHGAPAIRIGNLITDTKILVQAREAAQKLLEDDPGLTQERHSLLKTLVARREQIND